MSIIIQFGPPHLPSSGAVPPAPACIVEAETTLDMGLGLENEPDVPVATEDDSSVASVTASVVSMNHELKERQSLGHTTNHGYPSCFGLPYQDHNYGAPPPPTPPHSPPSKFGVTDEDTNFSIISTSTNNDEEGQEEQSITRCICDFDHDDEYMICCDHCSVWQHVDCMGLDRSNIPETYMCERCEPRKVDKQKAKALQARKKEEMTDSSSDESGDDDNSLNQTTGHLSGAQGSRSKKIRRKRKDKKAETRNEQDTLIKKLKNSKSNKDKSEGKKARVRNRSKSKSESTSTADEEAQDAWDSSLHKWVDKYEEAMINQYSPEVQLWTVSLKMNGQHDDLLEKISEQLRVQLCKVVEQPDNQKKLTALHDLSGDQVIVEYRGKFLSIDQFRDQNPIFNKRFFPFVLFYKPHKDDADLCVDAREYGNDARFVRRSCTPNAEIRHIIQNGLLHLYLFSSKAIKRDEEITIPFDFNYKECIRDVECACEDDNCPVTALHNQDILKDISIDKKKKGKKILSIEDDSSHSFTTAAGSAVLSSPSKSKAGHIKSGGCYNIQQINTTASVAVALGITVTTTADSTTDAKLLTEQETDEQVTERRKKMTREERKIDAIMRAFERMEKTAKRRQQALERMAQQRAQQQKQNELEKEQPQQQQDQQQLQDHEDEEQHQQEEEDQDLRKNLESASVSGIEEEKQNFSLTSETAVNDEVKLSAPLSSTPQALRHKKGKRRRGSGTPGRRRTRTSSGGSDILSPDEALNAVAALPGPLLTPIMSSPVASSAAGTIAVTCSATSSPCISPGNYVIPKTKRFLMHEWLQEKAEATVPVSCPLTIHTELSWDLSTASPTCYVRCTRDSPNAGGISAAHLRRSSTSSTQSCGKQSSSLGSAKKRWLRQAMYESGRFEPDFVNENSAIETGPCSPLHNGSISPNSHSDTSSPCISPHGDVVTPLKKRRLMRESLESLPSRSPSPILATPNDWPASLSFGASPEHSNSVMEETFSPTVLGERPSSPDNGGDHFEGRPTNESSTLYSGLNGLGTCLMSAAKDLEKEWGSKNTCRSSMEASISSSCESESNKHCVKKWNACSGEGESTITNCDFTVANSNSPETSQDSLCLDLTCQSSPDSGALCNRSKMKKKEKVDSVVSESIKETSDTSLSDGDCSSSSHHKRNASSTNVQNFETEFKPQDLIINNPHKRFTSKDDAGQEPSSTTTDCVSSSSTAVNISINKPVLCNNSVLSQAHVSSSCPPSSDSVSSVHNQLLPGAGHVSSSSSLSSSIEKQNQDAEDPVCKNAEPETNGKINSTVSSSVLPVCPVNKFIAQVNKDNSQQVFLQGNSNVSSSITASSSVPSTGQKRKMSLSEYRKRMREHANTTSNSSSSSVDSNKGSNMQSHTTLKKIELPDGPIKLSPLPFFDPLICSEQKKSSQKSTSKDSPKKESTDYVPDKRNNVFASDKSPEQRERLSQRLKNEFGILENDSDVEKDKPGQSQVQSVSPLKLVQNTTPLLSLCTQPPPPPPPPTGTTSPASPGQYVYPTTQPYSQQPYIVAQVATPYIAQPPPLPPQTTLPVLHHPTSCIPTPAGSHTLCPVVQSPTRAPTVNPHSLTFAPGTATSLLLTPQSGYNSIANTQNYATPPPPPPPQQQSYHTHYNQGIFK